MKLIFFRKWRKLVYADRIIPIILIFSINIFLFYNIFMTKGMVIFYDLFLPFSTERFLNLHYPMWNEFGSSNNYEFINRLVARIPIFILSYVPIISTELIYKLWLFSIILIAGLSMYFLIYDIFSNYGKTDNYGKIDKKTLYIASIIGAIFYMYNPRAIHEVLHPALSFAYAIFPLMVLFWIKFLYNREKKYLLGTVFVLTINAASPHYFIWSLLILAILFILAYKNLSIELIKDCAIGFLLLILLNIYWMLPIILGIKNGGEIEPWYLQSVENVELLSRNSDILNVIRITDFWRYFVMFDTYPFWTLASFMIPILVFSSILFFNLYPERFKNIVIVFLGMGFLFIFLGMGLNSPVRQIYEILINLPQGWLFRAPNRWAFLVAFVYSFLIGTTIIGISLRFRSAKSIIRKSLLVSILIIISIYIFPGINEYLFVKYIPIQLPNDYMVANNVLAQELDERNFSNSLWLPENKEIKTTWAGDRIIGQPVLGIDRSSSMPSLGSYSKGAKNYIYFISESIINNNTYSISSLLSVANIRYIVVHDDIPSITKNIKKLKNNLNLQNNISILNNTGFISIYKADSNEKMFFIPNDIFISYQGLDKLNSLSLINNFSKIAIVYPTENGYDVNMSSGIIMKKREDVILNFIPTLKKIMPFGYTDHDRVSTYWSRARIYDPFVGKWRYYIDKRNISNWDIELGNGIVVTSSKDKLSIPFKISDNKNYYLFVRYFNNRNGGKIGIRVDNNTPRYINAKDNMDQFIWENVGNITVKGDHKIILENLQGFNAINIFAIVPVEDYDYIAENMRYKLKEKRMIYILEAESDLYYQNAKISKKFGGDVSNGEVLSLNKNAIIWQNIDIMKKDNYIIALRGSGKFQINIANRSYVLNSDSMNFVYSPIMDLDVGKYRFEINPLNISTELSYLDVVWIYSEHGNNTVNKIFEIKENNAELSNYTKINPTLWNVNVNATYPFMLSFAEAYDPLWEAVVYKNDKKIGLSKTIPLYSVVNSFWIKDTGNLEIMIRYKPQDWLEEGLVISVITFIFCLGYIFFRIYILRIKFQNKKS